MMKPVYSLSRASLQDNSQKTSYTKSGCQAKELNQKLLKIFGNDTWILISVHLTKIESQSAARVSAKMTERTLKLSSVASLRRPSFLFQ